MQFIEFTKLVLILTFIGQWCGQSTQARDLTEWNECRGDLRANYVDDRCSKERFISPALKLYLLRDFEGCVNVGLIRSGRRSAKRVTIIHKGIMADGRHSPESLHSFGRAIDIHSIKIKYSLFKNETINFEELGDRTFYNELRACWGKVINAKGGCPLIEDNVELTGSIGKEDEDHQRHLHLSVPFCANGLYDMDFFIR
jgi:hypothetical protein